MGSQGLEIQDIQALSDLKAAIGMFSEGTQNTLKMANIEINRTFEWLQERTNYWQHEIERAQYNLSRAQSDLVRCQNSGYYDDDGHYHQPYCGCEERAVEQARIYLLHCNEALQIVYTWHRRIEQAAEDHMKAANQLSRIADWHGENAQINLDQTATKYEAVQSISSHLDGSTGLAASIAGIIAETLSAHGSIKEEWADRGIQMINIGDLPKTEGVEGEGDFKKVSMDNVRFGLQRLQEMRYFIDNGTGNNSDYWAKLDQERGFEYFNGYQRIYDAFYGGSAIRIEKLGNDFTIINGQHRVWMARQMGIDQLPVHLVEKI